MPKCGNDRMLDMPVQVLQGMTVELQAARIDEGLKAMSTAAALKWQRKRLEIVVRQSAARLSWQKQHSRQAAEQHALAAHHQLSIANKAALAHTKAIEQAGLDHAQSLNKQNSAAQQALVGFLSITPFSISHSSMISFMQVCRLQVSWKYIIHRPCKMKLVLFVTQYVMASLPSAPADHQQTSASCNLTAR